MPIEPVKIPQNVYVEDRIVGPVTLRQLIILLGTGGFSYAIWTGIKNQMGAASVTITILCWIPFAIGVIFAFVRIQGISLTRFLLLMGEKMEKPAIRQWSPRRGIAINFQYSSLKEEKKTHVVTQPHREKLEELSAMLDRGPIAAAVQREQETATAASDETASPRPVDQRRIRAKTPDDSPVIDDIVTPAQQSADAGNVPSATHATLQDVLPPPDTRA